MARDKAILCNRNDLLRSRFGELKEQRLDWPYCIDKVANEFHLSPRTVENIIQGYDGRTKTQHSRNG